MMTNPWHIYLTVGIVALCVVSIMGYSLFIGDRAAHKYSSQIDATLMAQLEATTAHLWLEEILSGDRDRMIKSVWEHLDKSQWYIHALLEGDQDSECDYFALVQPPQDFGFISTPESQQELDRRSIRAQTGGREA